MKSIEICTYFWHPKSQKFLEFINETGNVTLGYSISMISSRLDIAEYGTFDDKSQATPFELNGRNLLRGNKIVFNNRLLVLFIFVGFATISFFAVTTSNTINSSGFKTLTANLMTVFTMGTSTENETTIVTEAVYKPKLTHNITHNSTQKVIATVMTRSTESPTAAPMPNSFQSNIVSVDNEHNDMTSNEVLKENPTRDNSVH